MKVGLKGIEREKNEQEQQKDLSLFILTNNL